MNKFYKLLSGGDLRSLGRSEEVLAMIKTQDDFDLLFECLYDNDVVAMRALDVIEKISATKPSLLKQHKKEIFKLCHTSVAKEVQWHLALILPRLQLSSNELIKARDVLTNWISDKKKSRIVRVNSIQGLFELILLNKDLLRDFQLTLSEAERENIPSINARIRIIRKKLNF